LNGYSAQHLPQDLVWPSSGFKNSLKRRRAQSCGFSPLYWNKRLPLVDGAQGPMM